MKCRLIEFNQVNEEDGGLVFMEELKDVPFEIKRVFYIFDNPIDAVRADHANKYADFLMVAAHGN